METPENSSLNFDSLGLTAELLQVIKDLNFTKPTPIQVQSIPALLSGKDLIGQSQTGSGKTVAFALPLLQKINLESKKIQAFVICPTRELGTQVLRDIRKLGRERKGLQVLSLVGGQPSHPQLAALRAGIHMAVGTPGRILDLFQRESVDLSSIQIVVLDEADKMFELGFEEDIKSILEKIPKARQTVLFSATFPVAIRKLSENYQRNPVRVTIAESQATTPQIQQFIYETSLAEKMHTLIRVLQQHPSQSIIIFCNQKITVAEIGTQLSQNNVSVTALHGDLEQRERDRAVALFRNGSHRILVATDVAARGLDIENIDLVVNFDLPLQTELYIHRIGRTGRAGRSGVAVTLATPREAVTIFEIENITGVQMQRPQLGFKNQYGLNEFFQSSAMQTISISGGRNDKLRPGDILGALTADPGGLQASEIGKIEISDRFAYVAVGRSQSQAAMEKLRNGKIKGKKFRVSLVK